MRPGALAPFEASLAQRRSIDLMSSDGSVVPLDVPRYVSSSDAADATVLDRCRGPVLDVGCGPGRFLEALADRGVAGLGVDISSTAVALTRQRGVAALRRSVFDPLPREGHWPTIVLLDGNVGIGGDVPALLKRLTCLLSAGGRIIVEVAGSEVDEVHDMRFGRNGSAWGPVFPWAVAGREALRGHAYRTGYSETASWSAGGREFCEFLLASRQTRIA